LSSAGGRSSPGRGSCHHRAPLALAAEVNVDSSRDAVFPLKGAEMAFTWNEIDRDWLLGDAVAVPAEEVVSAFNRAETILGRDWVEHVGATARGTLLALRIITIGQRLLSVDDAVRRETVIKKIRNGDSSAEAELAAVHIIRNCARDVAVELAPPVVVGEGERRPDFRVRRNGEEWTYVEVTQPDTSELKARLEQVLSRFTEVLSFVDRNFAIEVFLRREPTDNEILQIIERLRVEGPVAGPRRVDMPGLCVLVLDECEPGVVAPALFPDEPSLTRLGAARSLFGGDRNVARHIAARIPLSDERAEEFLRREAKQLPQGAPGLIMARMIREPTGMDAWPPLLRRRLQPHVHTRVGGVCLFHDASMMSDEGLRRVLKAKFVPNIHASHPLPEWITATLQREQPA
jgi:hypothetical protein